MNGHTGRLTTHTRPGLLGGPGQPTARESGSFPGGRSRPATQSLHYAPEAMTRRPDRLGSSPADKLTAAVTTAPGPTQRPAPPVVSSQSRPPSRARAARGRPSPFPPRLRRGRLPRKRPPARPAAGRSGRGRSPPPARLAHLFLRLLLLLLPQPPPPQPPEASLPLQQAHLFRAAPRPGAEGPPPGGKGGASGGRPRPLRAGLRVRNGRLPAASQRSDLRLRGPVGQAAATGPTAGEAGTRRIGLPGPVAWGFQSLPTLPVGAREGLWEKALGTGDRTCPRWVSGPPPAAPSGLTGAGRARDSPQAPPNGRRPKSCPWCLPANCAQFPF